MWFLKVSANGRCYLHVMTFLIGRDHAKIFEQIENMAYFGTLKL